MKVLIWRWVTGLALVIALAACSPALNWRKVELEDLVVLLPCKPDQAVRTVQLSSSHGGMLSVSMEMSGCEAGGALYAISHVHVADLDHAASTQAAWRQATLANLQASSPKVSQLQMANAFPGQSRNATTNRGSSAESAPSREFILETMNANRPDGTPVQAKLAWLRKGQDIYHVAVYGDKLDQEKTELLFSELHLQ